MSYFTVLDWLGCICYESAHTHRGSDGVHLLCTCNPQHRRHSPYHIESRSSIYLNIRHGWPGAVQLIVPAASQVVSCSASPPAWGTDGWRVRAEAQQAELQQVEAHVEVHV